MRGLLPFWARDDDTGIETWKKEGHTVRLMPHINDIALPLDYFIIFHINCNSDLTITVTVNITITIIRETSMCKNNLHNEHSTLIQQTIQTWLLTLFRPSISAPLLSRSSIHSTLPLRAARMRGVLPYWARDDDTGIETWKKERHNVRLMPHINDIALRLNYRVICTMTYLVECINIFLVTKIQLALLYHGRTNKGIVRHT